MVSGAGVSAFQPSWHDVLLLVVARTAPASEDGVQLGGVKRPRVLTARIAREPAETSGAIKEPRPWQAATRLADGERSDERAIGIQPPAEVKDADQILFF